jgi:hypothetical protein
MANFDGKRNGIDDAGELHQRAVAHELNRAPVILSRLRLDQFLAMGLEGSQRAHFILAHEAAVADHVGG